MVADRIIQITKEWDSIPGKNRSDFLTALLTSLVDEAWEGGKESVAPQDLYERIALDLGQMLTKKDKAYGRAWVKVADFMRLLFPEGIKPEQYVDALLIVRVFDKLMRIATDKNAFNEDAWRDLAGYGILGASRKEKRTNQFGHLVDASGVNIFDPECEHCQKERKS